MKENPGSQTQNIRKGNIDEMIEKEIDGNIQPSAVKYVEIFGKKQMEICFAKFIEIVEKENYRNRWK